MQYDSRQVAILKNRLIKAHKQIEELERLLSVARADAANWKKASECEHADKLAMMERLERYKRDFTV